MATCKKNIPDTIRKKIIVMAAGGQPVAEIMRATGQTAPTISKVCKDAKISISRKREKPTEEKRQKIMEMHSEGYTPTEITWKTGISTSTVRKVITDAKIITFRNVEAHEEAAQETKQPIQFTLEAESSTDKVLEALCLIRDAVTMLIDARMA